ncbi:MAG: nicotinate-nucleotide adenylyltransferase [Xanthobacter sp.]
MSLPPVGEAEVRRLPLALPGMRIGLMGGSFNPPHAAHRAVALLAMKRLRLDAVWWLVTPGNPLKDNRALPPLEQRVAAAQKLARHPRIIATGCEARWGGRYTYDTVRQLQRRRPGVRFVWLMGADNLVQFHRWERWRDLAGLVPIAVVDRMGASLSALSSPAARTLAHGRVAEHEAARLPALKPPAWVFLHGMKSTLSSSKIRAQLGKEGGDPSSFVR